MKFVEEFKKFALRGNVLDMAVGVIIGGAFSKIVTSLVNDIIMPIISVLTGKIDISALQFSLSSRMVGAEPIIIRYGQFLQNILNFLIIGISVFVMVKLVNRLIKRHEENKPIPKPTNEELLLGEIRDILKNK